MIQELNSEGMLPDQGIGQTNIQTNMDAHALISEEAKSDPASLPIATTTTTIVDAVREALKKVEDPEIHMDLITLNLIYDIKEEAGIASVLMTFTTPLCPFGPALVDEVKKATQAVPGVTRADVKVTFTPPWEPSPEIKMMLGI